MLQRALQVIMAFAASAILVILLDLTSAAAVYGPEYVWRLIVWFHPTPDDWQRFPARPICPSSNPAKLPVAPEAEALVRAAFRQASGSAGPMADVLQRDGTTSFLVLRGGALAFEGYYNGHQRDTVENAFSISKSVTALLVGTAMADGLIPSVETPAEILWPEVVGFHGSTATLRDVLHMTIGAPLHEYTRYGPLSRPWADSSLLYFATDLRTQATRLRVEAPPGQHFLYDDRAPMLMGLLIERVTGVPVAQYLERRLWRPLGTEFPASWSLDRARGFEKMESGFNPRAIDLVRLGELVRRDGVGPSGEQLVPREWIAAIATPPDPAPDGFPFDQFGQDGFYGYFWWGHRRVGEPNDLEAIGIFGQHLYVSRAKRTVIVRMGNREAPGWSQLLRRMVDALPLPPEP